MPTIHQIKSNIIENSISSVVGYEQRYNKYLKARNLDQFMFYCDCLHPEYNHHEFNNFICGYSGMYCECRGFNLIKLNLVVEITELDLFEYENKDHSERDSFNYWNEYNLWRMKNENNELSILYDS